MKEPILTLTAVEDETPASFKIRMEETRETVAKNRKKIIVLKIDYEKMEANFFNGEEEQ